LEVRNMKDELDISVNKCKLLHLHFKIQLSSGWGNHFKDLTRMIRKY
jgi:hypothetical protein